MLFAFSVMPKTYLHDWVANHTDYYSFHSNDETVTKTGFNCHCDDLVVSAPFTAPPAGFYLNAFLSFTTFVSPAYAFLFANAPATKDSRGPPRLA